MKTQTFVFLKLVFDFMDCNQILIFSYQEFPCMVCHIQRERYEMEGECERFDCLDRVCLCGIR